MPIKRAYWKLASLAAIEAWQAMFAIAVLSARFQVAPVARSEGAQAISTDIGSDPRVSPCPGKGRIVKSAFCETIGE